MHAHSNLIEHFQEEKFIQLTFWELTQTEKLQNQVNTLKTSLEKQRKCQFARIGEIKKEMIDLKERLEIIEKGLCSNRE
jgi:Tfp pilus assembly protein PilO